MTTDSAAQHPADSGRVSPSTPRLRVVVVGAGVFGAAGALELRRRKHDVALLDPGPIPHPKASSTDISKIVRMDYGADALYTRLVERALEGWRAWNGEGGAAGTDTALVDGGGRDGAPLYHSSGFLCLSAAEPPPGSFEHESFALLTARGHLLERLDRAAVAARFPAWNAARFGHGYFNPVAGWAESGEVVRRLVARGRRAGVGVLEGRALVRLMERGSTVTGVVDSTGEAHAADRVVIAAGAWTPKLLPELRDVMWPVAQPVLHFLPGDPSAFVPPRFPVWAADIATTGWYGFPAQRDGIVKIANHGAGTPIDPDGPRSVAELLPGTEDRFRAFLGAAIPSLAEAPLSTSRLCLYCDTWDGHLWIDAHPGRPGLVVAAGGSGHGFKLAPILGPIIADRVEEREEGLGPGGVFTDGRFRWRSRPGGARDGEAARHLTRS